MESFTYKVTDENGIHARPAGVIVNCAKQFSSYISVKNGEKTADCKKLFSVMSLGAVKGDELTVSANGNDEKIAAKSVRKVMEETGL